MLPLLNRSDDQFVVSKPGVEAKNLKDFVEWVKQTLIDEYGPDAVAGLASSRATNEDCYVMQRLMRAAIGTHNIDNCSRA